MMITLPKQHVYITFTIVKLAKFNVSFSRTFMVNNINQQEIYSTFDSHNKYNI